MQTKRAFTIGEIGRQTGWPNHKVEYFIKSRKIEPVLRAGNIRVFGEDIVERLLSETARTADKEQKP